MKAFWKRLISIVLAVMMLVSCLPVSALAEEPIGEEPIVEVPEEEPAPEPESEPTGAPDSDNDEGEGELPGNDGEGELPGNDGEAELPGNDDPDKTNEEIEALSEEIREYADGLFLGDPDRMLTLTLAGGTDEKMLAGDSVIYSIGYNFAESMPWYRDYDKGRTLFDEYKNARVIVTLPAGLVLTGSGTTREYSSDSVDDNGNHTYVFNLGDIPADSSFPASFKIAVFICGNGTQDAIRSFPSAGSVRLEAELPVLNKAADPYILVDTYDQYIEGTFTGIETESPDEWGIEKRVAQSDVTIDKDAAGGPTATVKYTISVGMLDPTQTVKTLLKSNDEAYTRNGRDAFDANAEKPISINDTLAATFLKDGAEPKTLTPSSVTIRKVGTGTQAAALTPGADVSLTGALALNTATVNSGGDNSSGYSAEVGCFTQYEVTAVYSLDEDMIAHFEHPEANSIHFENAVTLKYKLAKKDPDQDSAEAEITATVPERKPAEVKVSKQFTNYKKQSGSYDPATYGAIRYTIESTDDKSFKLYERNGSAYVPTTTDERTSFDIDPNKTYYITPGIAYKVSEVLTSEQKLSMTEDDPETKTPLELEKWDVSFVNNEKAGDLKVLKKDDSGKPIPNVSFSLKDSGGKDYGTKQTGTDGTALWEKLPWGTYTLTEKVPAHHVPHDGNTEWTINITENGTVEKTVVNDLNMASLSLTKYIGTTANPTTWAEDGFGSFALERKTGENVTWTTVEQDIHGAAIPSSIVSNGQIVVELPAFDDSRTPYYYRFRETIPEDADYYAYNPVGGYYYSREVSLVTDDGIASRSTVNVDMVNYKKVKITLRKVFSSPKVSGGKLVWEDSTLDSLKATVQLYYWDGTEMVPFGSPKEVVNSQSATWENLPSVRSDGEVYEYYVLETPVSGYVLDTQNAEKMVIEGNTYLRISASDYGTTKTLRNIEQIVPVIIYKKNYYTKKFVSGAGVTVTKQKDTSGTVILQNEMIETSAGLVAYLEPGAKYNLVETVNNTGLTQQNATSTKPIVIDLSDIPQMNYTGYTLKTYTVYNKPDPTIQIDKKDKLATDTSLTGAEFTVFTRDSESGTTFSKYLDKDGQEVVISATNALTSVRLPAGTYYVAETKVPAGYLDPNLVPAEYPDYVQGTCGEKSYAFAVMDVKDAKWSSSTKTDNQASFTFYNVPNKGSISVQKYVDGQPAYVKDVAITLSYNDGTGSKTASGTTDASGVCTIENLPVYDTNGNKIVYTISEGGRNADGSFTDVTMNDRYYFVADGQTATLTVGTKTTKDSTGETLRVENATYTTIEAHKYSRHTWEFVFTHMQYPMGGVHVGLFELDPATNTWNRVKDSRTDHTGAISYDHLRRDKSYAIVELSCDNPLMFPFVNGVEVQFAGDNCTAIPAGQLSLYNALTIDAETAENLYTRKKITDLGDLINQDHWVQFDITKYIDKDLDVNDTAINKDEDEPYNNAVFRLYRTVVPSGTTEVEFSPDEWDLMGTYVSGTFYDDAGKRVSGQFRSDVDQKANADVVYMLVEVSAGPGAGTINPNFKYTFWQEKNKNYTIALPEGATVVRKNKYTLNAINHDDILNSRSKGKGGILISTIRIAKWFDDFDANGDPNGNYRPLPNTEFGVYLDADCNDDSCLETLNVGLDSSTDPDLAKAWAQGAVYGLKFSGTGRTEGTLVNYADVPEDEIDAAAVKHIVDVEELGTGPNESYTIYGIPVYLKELDAPDGYAIDENVHPMYLCFVELHSDDEEGESHSASSVFSDAFFATDREEAYALAQNQRGTASWVTWTDADGNSSEWHANGKYRIVDYPMLDTKIRVVKYGYTPTTGTTGKTSDELKAMSLESQRELSGVTMTLERYDEETSSWKYWDYLNKNYKTSASAFTTREDGSYLFANGLPRGKYRIIETSLGEENTIYEIAYPDAAHAREFTVGDNAATVYMYNPTKVGFSLTKQDADGNALSGTTFTLTPASGSALTETTKEDGTVAFTNLASGTYRLTESKDGYSNQYLQAYVNSLLDGTEKTQLLALIGKNGACIGYNYQTAGTDGDKDVVIDSIAFDSVNYTFTVKNPKKCDLSLLKVDEEDNTKTLSGAKFQYYYKAFDKWSGEMTVSAPDASWTGWTSRGEKTTEDGQIKLTGQEPGIYAFYETAAPDGYTIIKDSRGNDIIYYVVVTGGMPVTVTGLPGKVTAKPADTTKDSFEVTTLFTNPTAEVPVENRPKSSATATKSVDAGQYPDEEKSKLTWTVRLALYDLAQGGNRVGYAEIGNQTSGAVTFTTDGTHAAQLSQGEVYYLQETVTSTPTTNYRILKVNGTTVTDPVARFPVYIDGPDAVEIEVVNAYMRAKVLFNKVDGKTGKLLSGAQFVVCDADGAPIQGASVTEVTDDTDAENGKVYYVADIPLSSTEATTYTIVETVAPVHYLLEDGVKLTVNGVTPSNNYFDWRNVNENEKDKYLTNLEGWDIRIVKYDNIHGAEGVKTVGAGDASFKLYQQDKNTGAWSAVFDTNQSTDESGALSWTLRPEVTYAFREADYNATKFSSIESVWCGSVMLEPVTIQVGETTYDNCFIVSNLDKDYTFEAYNKPKLQTKIVKEDVGGYPEAVVPYADFAIYELEDRLPTTAKEAEAVILGLSGKTPVYTGSTTTQETGTRRTYDLWSGRDATKNYVVVETKVGPLEQSGPYNTLNKDDSRVVWYQAINAETTPDSSVTPEYILKNVYSDVTVALDKSVTANSEAETAKAAADTDNAAVAEGTTFAVDTLLKGDRKVIYTLAPTVTSHNQPLQSFVLNDDGLTFTDSNGDAEGQYTFTELVLAKPSHATDTFKTTPLSDVISAKLVWDGDETKTRTVALSGDSTSVTVPDGTQSFSISYFCQGVLDATNGEYALGRDFVPGTVTVKATAKQIADGTVENPATEITSFTNEADVALTYWQWSEAGGKTSVTLTDDASAEILVKSIKLPVVSLEKTSLGYPEAVKVGDVATYILTVQNLSDTEDFENPVVLDMLPTGVTFTQDYTVSSGTFGETFESSANVYIGRQTVQAVGDSVEDGTVVVGDSETGVVFELTGKLKPQSEITISFTAKVNPSAALYGDKISNYAFLSSSKTGYHVDGNPHGYSFCLDDETFPGTLPEEAGKFIVDGSTEPEQLPISREAGLHDAFGKYANNNTRDYVWVKAKVSVPVVAAYSLTLKKAIQGDRDSGYSAADDFLATATRTNSTDGAKTEGWVDYRLSVINGTDDRKEHIVISDVLSKAGDALESKWDVVMDSITSVSYTGGKTIPAGQYTVLYYTGAISTAENAVVTAAGALLDPDRTTWPPLSVLSADWKAPDGVASKESVTAFLIVFSSEVVLDSGDGLLITYHTKTKDVPNNSDFEKIAYENNANRFRANWLDSMYIGNATSNTVYATLMDEPVKVAGDLWIDEDWDGTQGEKNHRDYDDYVIVQKLKEKISFAITDERYATTSADDKADGELGVPVNESAESIKRFSFIGLGAATQVRDPLYIDEELNPKALKTDNPFRYSLTATLSDSSLLDIFKLSKLGAGHYMSDKPTEIPDANAHDNNFFTGSSSVVYKTKPFYLQYSSATDQTKDIGFMMERDLEIAKLSSDASQDPVEGAEFQMFGPFDENKAASGGTLLKFSAVTDEDDTILYYVYDPAEGTVDTLVTDANGKISVKGLNWWKEYVITETKAAPGYELTDAAASADSTSGAKIRALDGAEHSWVLELPDKNKETKTDKVTVSNVRECEIPLQIKKIVNLNNGGAYVVKENDFTFELFDSNRSKLDEKKNNANGVAVFETQTVKGAGDYTFYIKEKDPGEGNRIPGVQYSNMTVRAEAHVAWSSESNQLTCTVTYKDAKGNPFTGDPAITNEYIPEPAKAQIGVVKVMNGKERPETWKQTFTFTLTGKDGAPMPQKDGADQTTVEIRDNGTVYFPEIAYDTAGDYTYTLVESVESKDPSYRYDETTHTINVHVTDLNPSGQGTGKLAVTISGDIDTPTVTTTTGVVQATCTFTNEYHPTPATVALPVRKLFSAVGTDADPLLEMRSFTFQLAGGIGVPMPASGGETVTVNEASGWSGTFGVISYDTAGIYTYTVTEDQTNPYPNYTYDTGAHTYTVTVTDNGGSLSAVWKLDNGTETDQQKTASFTNPYQSKPTTIRAYVEKKITGNDRPDGQKKTFTFTLTGLNGAPMPAGAQDNKVTVQTTDEETAYFGEIKYEHCGKYEYTVVETAGEDTHYSYDTAVRTFTVAVADNVVTTDTGTDTQLYATISSEDKSVVILKTDAGVQVVKTVITNTYTPDAAALGIKVKKVMEGNLRPEDWEQTFKFTLTPSAGAPMPKVSETSDENQTFVEITDHGEVSFNSIRFTKAGTYTYTLTEAAVDKTGYTAVVRTHTIHASVADDGGQMKVKAYLDNEAVPENAVVSAEVSPEFKNRYDNQPIKLVLPVRKQVTGKAPSVAKQFEFVLETEESGTPMPAGTGNHVFVTGSATGWFGEIEYTKAGTYTYTVHEVIPEDPDGDGKIDGYTYDTATHTYVVTVTDTEGVLSAAWTLDGKALESAAEGTTTEALAGPVAEFTNTYGPDSATVQIPVRKIVQGPAPADKDFVFELKPVGTAPMPADAEQGVSTVTVHGSDTNTFGIITYEDAGEYSYTVSEIDGKLPGYTYDTTAFTVDVHVTDDGRGNLSATYNVLINEQVIREIAFTNPYEPDETTAELKVQKTVNGNDRPEDWKQTFEFTLTGQNGAPMPTGTTAGSTEKKITIVDNDTKTFGTITYTAVGTYTYELKEAVRTVKGYTFDSAVRTIRVDVSDSSDNGQLSAKAYLVGNPDTEIGELIEGVLTVTSEFINTYTPDTVKIQLPAKKTLTGNPVPAGEDKEFTFSLTAVGENTPMPAAGGETVKVLGAAEGKFGEIEYTKAGTYTYTVKESVPTDAVNNKKDGYTYDTTEHTYVVTVTDNKGQLEASWKLDDKTTGGTAEFVNDYKPDPTDTVLLVSKTVEGNERPDDWKQTFTFTLTGKNGAPMPIGTTDGSTEKSVKIEDNGTETLGTIRFTSAGTYDYELAETVETIQGYTFDGAVRKIRVVVTDTASKLSAKAYLGETEIGKLVGGVLTVTSPFVNKYDPDDAEVVLEVRKTMEGQDRPEDWKQTFKFTLEAVEEAPMPAEGQTFVEITDNGLKSFNKIVYTEADTYKYHLSEEKVDKNGYTFDETDHEIQVIVTDNKGVLEAVTSIDGVQTVTGEFTNKYTANPVKIQLPVKKELTGNEIPKDEEGIILNKEFTFILKAKNEEPMPEVGRETVTIVGADEEVFGEIEFTEPGTYSYTVEEVEGTEPGYAYDKATHTFTVTVTDNKGDLEAAWVVDDATETVAVFTNTYIPDATALAIPVEKKVVGSTTPSDKTFTFLLKGSTATTPMPEGAVNGESRASIVGSGESAFPLITYREAGYYTYTVTEIVGNDTGYVYDKTQYTVHVTVVDKDAKLSASYVIEGAEKIVFTNTYHPEPAKFVIPVRKNISGYANTRVKFTFDLTAVTRNAPMPKESSISIVGEGRAEFDAITFSEAGEYVYELRERYADSDRFIYDTAVRRIVVKAEDHDGNITLSWTINGRSVNESVFTNVYIPPEETVVVPPVVKQITGEKPKQASTFTFVLQAQSASNPMPAGSVRGTKEITITGAGSSDFGSITFTSPGTYVYTVSERNTGADNYTYDTTVYTVTYQVEERGGRLFVETTVQNGRAAASKIVFVNKYVPPREKLPQTGALWWPVALMLTAGLALVLIGLRRRRGYRNGQ